jgi:hypothetical protein
MTPDNVKQFCIDNCIPPGYQYMLVMISITKRALAGEIPSEFRMQFLEHLDKLTTPSDSLWLSADMVAAVEPMCEKGNELAREAQALGTGKSLHVRSLSVFDAYAKFFPAFASLNPSLITALEMMPGRRQSAPMLSEA